jgi:signal transduction histidine kinase
LLNIINDIIDISRIEAGEFKVIKKRYEVDEILNSLYFEFDHILLANEEKKNIRLIYLDKPELHNSYIYTDIERLNQVFRNLLTNAIKFTSDGTIEFSCDIDTDCYRFYVKDTGIGIPAAKHKLIFESFRQADETETRNFGGTGLGLAISKKIVEILGGKIWVESEEGKGSVFYFTHPSE